MDKERIAQYNLICFIFILLQELSHLYPCKLSLSHSSHSNFTLFIHISRCYVNKFFNFNFPFSISLILNSNFHRLMNNVWCFFLVFYLTNRFIGKEEQLQRGFARIVRFRIFELFFLWLWLICNANARKLIFRFETNRFNSERGTISKGVSQDCTFSNL